MKTLSTIPEKLKTAGRVLFNGQVTTTGDIKGIIPLGTNGIAFLLLVTMANAADLVLNVVTADDADGTNPVAIADDVPIFKDDVRQTLDAKTITVDDDSGVFTVVMNIPPALIPEGKYICLEFEDSNAANILSAVAIDDSYYESGNA